MIFVEVHSIGNGGRNVRGRRLDACTAHVGGRIEGPEVDALLIGCLMPTVMAVPVKPLDRDQRSRLRVPHRVVVIGSEKVLDAKLPGAVRQGVARPAWKPLSRKHTGVGEPKRWDLPLIARSRGAHDLDVERCRVSHDCFGTVDEPCKRIGQIRERRCVLDVLRFDAVDVHIHRLELGLWIDQR